MTRRKMKEGKKDGLLSVGGYENLIRGPHEYAGVSGTSL